MAATEASRRIAQAKASAIADLRASVSRVPARVLQGRAVQAAAWREAAERAHRLTCLDPRRVPLHDLTDAIDSLSEFAA